MNLRLLAPAALAAGLLGLTGWGVTAAQGGDVFTDPKDAGPDYAIQGEYRSQADGRSLGVQVIALGRGAFQAVFLPGGLPGAGWDGKTRVRVEGRHPEGDDKTVVFGKEGDAWTATLDGGKLDVSGPEGLRMRLRKMDRTSPTLGAKPPQGAVVLFDGTNVDQWQGGQMTPDGLLKVGTRTKRSFEDFILHFEFRTPFQPTARGQGRGNSGLFLQDRYEVQILDSFGLDGKDNECGGFYSQKAPDVNMCFPPLAWQTYDIDFEQARFDADGKKIKPATATVRHNGVVIHDRYQLPGPGPVGKKEDNTGGVFQVQNHSNPVVVRNVWLVEKKP